MVLYMNLLRLQPDAAFSVQWSALMIFIVVIGGRDDRGSHHRGDRVLRAAGSPRGLRADLPDRPRPRRGRRPFRAPRGLWGLITSRGHWQLFPLRRRLVADEPEARPGEGTVATSAGTTATG